ncbi:MAG: DUF4160 domain-containing protein [Alphaproteobacteria bacterium]|nr:DUF4160 domain-containing protein [Alphaproteobacteria bacterium]
MPTVSQFFGIIIRMYLRGEHNPPHFHAMYGDDEALIDIGNVDVLEGHLPRRALALVLEWAEEHRDALLENWELCRRKQLPNVIPPLE